jgi:excisionase family DNA binding protein
MYYPIVKGEKMEYLSNLPDVLTPKELSDVLKIGITNTYKLLKQQQIKSIKIGNKYIIPKKSVVEFLTI